MSKSVVELYVDEASSERGVQAGVVRAILRDFIRVLHQGDLRSDYFGNEEGSIVTQVYFALGEEAAYHLSGLIAHGGQGHDPDQVLTELQYRDPHLKRFYTTIQRWQEEINRERADKE